MNYNKKTVCDVDVSGKKVLLRCDFNVPQDKETGAITSDKRIVAALPTIRYLLDRGAAVIACSHLGKPEPKFEKWVKKQTEKGKDPASLTEEKWQKSLRKLTLAPVAERLSELLGKEVIFAHDVVGEDARAKAAAQKHAASAPQRRAAPPRGRGRWASSSRSSSMASIQRFILLSFTASPPFPARYADADGCGRERILPSPRPRRSCRRSRG